MKILILGAGGVGGYFGARLQEAGADVTWLVRDQRLALLREQGLRVRSAFGDMHLEVKAVTAATVKPEYELVLLAPKAYDLEDGLASLAGALSGDALLLPFLNGLAHLDLLDQRYGRERVAGGVAHIAATLGEDGAIVHLNQLHSLTVGPRAPSQVERLQQFHALCRSSRFDAIYTDDIEQQLWTKWTFLAALAGATTLFRGSIGQIMASAAGRDLVDAMYRECLSVAAAWGFAVAEEGQARSRAILLKDGSDFTASMYRDLITGLRTEHQHVLGELCHKGAAKEVAMPLMLAAWCHMEVETGK